MRQLLTSIQARPRRYSAGYLAAGDGEYDRRYRQKKKIGRCLAGDLPERRTFYPEVGPRPPALPQNWCVMREKTSRRLRRFLSRTQRQHGGVVEQLRRTFESHAR